MAILGQILLTLLFTASMLAVGWLAWRALRRQDAADAPQLGQHDQALNDQTRRHDVDQH